MADAETTGLVNLTFPSAGVALVSLNLPRVRNAMTAELTEAWVVAMDTVRADRRLRAVVVTGTGTAFCSGADLSWLDQGSSDENTPDRLREKMLPFYRAWLAPLPAYPGHRRGERTGGRGGALPGPGLRPAVCRDERYVQRPVPSARHAWRHGRELAVA
jgi:hypothetical protein